MGSIEKNICFHCGEKTIINPISFDDKTFCCDGCKMVFSLLKDNNMETYYAMEQTPGSSHKNLRRIQGGYAVLDTPDVLDSILMFQAPDIEKVCLRLPNIHCASCLWLLENLYKLQPGISSSRVNFIQKEATITYDPNTVSLRSVAQLLEAIGYPPELNLGVLNRNETGMSKASKQMLYRLAVAGFAFGNIMLMSFPDYLSSDGYKEDIVLKAFPYMNFALALPMVFYSGWGYLSSAWQGVQSRHLNMDVPIALGFLALFFWSAYEVFAQAGTGYFDSLAGLVFFLLIGKWVQDRTYKKIAFDRDYRSYFPIWASKLKDGVEVPTSLNQLLTDDIILVRNREMIPADGILLDGNGVVDYSFVTGESEPVRVEQGAKVFAGGHQQGAAIKVQISSEVSQSYLTSLWNNDAFTKEQKRPASALSDLVGKRFTYVVLAIAFITLLFWLTVDMGVAFYAFASVLIVACPCAISLAIPFTLGNIISVLGKNKAFIKNTMVIEDLAQVDHLVFDKTGTLTQKGIFFAETKRLTSYQEKLVKTLVMQSSHPVSKLLQRVIEVAPFGRIDAYQEVPGHGISGSVEGHLVEVKAGAFEGEKTGTLIVIDGEEVDSFITIDKIRAGVAELFLSLRKKYKLSLISGDNDDAKLAMEELFGSTNNIFFKQQPEDKLDYISSLQAKGEKVLMVGDGLNDAGALKVADVGLVLSEDGNNFTPSSDIILSATALSKLNTLLDLSQASIKIIYKTYLFALVYNVIGLSYAIRGQLSPVIAAILMPLSSISVVLLGVILGSLLLKKKSI